MSYQLPTGVTSQTVQTERLLIHYLTSGPDDGTAVVFLHGNIASSLFWDETLAALPSDYRGVACDMRGFGDTEPMPIDATRGVGDFADDLGSLLDTLEIDKAHLVGWSTGGITAMQYAADHPVRVLSLSLVDSVPPHGFGGTGDLAGTPINADFSGTGAAIVPPEVLERIQNGDTSSESDMSPRTFMKAFYWKQGYDIDSDREDAFVGALLKSVVSEGNLPGDIGGSGHWPGFGPGVRGVNNALSGKYANVIRLADVDPKPPLLWIQGTDDLVVSDASLYDMGNLGNLGMIPDYPGEDVYPIQPMVSQFKWFLERYRDGGGRAVETIIDGAGHAPHIDHPDEFQAAFFGFLGDVGGG